VKLFHFPEGRRKNAAIRLAGLLPGIQQLARQIAARILNLNGGAPNGRFCARAHFMALAQIRNPSFRSLRSQNRPLGAKGSQTG
jgi:hypothetical protein